MNTLKRLECEKIGFLAVSATARRKARECERAIRIIATGGKCDQATYEECLREVKEGGAR